MIDDRLETMPGSSVVGEPLSLRPLQVRIKDSQNGRDVAGAECCLEFLDKLRWSSHGTLSRLGESQNAAGRFVSTARRV